jgi:hypothetical protein
MRFPVILLALAPAALQAQRQAASPPIKACSVASREEVKKHLPWKAALDQFKSEEEPIGAYGSSCNHPSVLIQVMPSSKAAIDSLRRISGIETISGLGDEAYFSNNHDQYAEVYVRSGNTLLTLQANLNKDMATVKPGALNLARALLPKLR